MASSLNWSERFIERVGDSLEVLEHIKECLANQDRDLLIELVNGYIDRARSDLIEAHGEKR